MQTIDLLGDHATCCKRTSDNITRHNTLRDLIARFAPGLIGIREPTSGRRLGDVILPRWNEEGGLAIDVAITSPLTKSSCHLVAKHIR